MKLDYIERMRLRKLVEEKLNNVSKGQRIHLDKELLEELLFETVSFDIKNGTEASKITFKLPFWSGDFLSKLDLSEISFKNVSWNLLKPGYDISEDELRPYINKLFVDSESSRPLIVHFIKLINEKNDEYTDYKYFSFNSNENRICYKNTNARINFEESFESTYLYGMCVRDCIFSGTDLSHVDISNFESLDFVDFSNTGIKISNISKFINGSFQSINLNSNDLSNITINAEALYDVLGEDSYKLSIKNCGINIVGDQTETVSTLIEGGNLDGCYLNGKLISSLKKSPSVFAERNRELNKMKADLFAAVTQSIEEQKKSFKK